MLNSLWSIHINTVNISSSKVQYRSLCTWDINSSQHQHRVNGYSSEHSTHGVCNPICMIHHQCNEQCQAILDHFLRDSKPSSWSHSLQKSPTDDRQHHFPYHPTPDHKQCPNQMNDEIFPPFLSCCLLYLPIWSSSMSELQQNSTQLSQHKF